MRATPVCAGIARYHYSHIMAKALKDLFDASFFQRLSEDLRLVLPHFDHLAFVRQVMDEAWEHKTYKQRITHITSILGQHLPSVYAEAIGLILRLLEVIQERLPDTQTIDDKRFNLFHLDYGPILDHFIELFGLEDFETSVKAMERITQFTTCEFATHAFILRYPEAMMQQMLRWASHEHWAVRRLASEGCRPRLPWAMSLPSLKQDPTPILPILERLKNDPSRFVRLSVANNLNDISKDHPDVVIALAQQWWGEAKAIDWVVKHGCRTLIKQGHMEALQLLGIAPNPQITLADFRLLTPHVAIGERVSFTFQVANQSDSAVPIRLAYAIYYQKANGTLSKKVYPLSQTTYPPQACRTIMRHHPLRLVTTRRLHLGLHRVAIIVNGQESQAVDFTLIE